MTAVIANTIEGVGTAAVKMSCQNCIMRAVVASAFCHGNRAAARPPARRKVNQRLRAPKKVLPKSASSTRECRQTAARIYGMKEMEALAGGGAWCARAPALIMMRE